MGPRRGRGWFSYLLGSRPLVYLGEISFAFTSSSSPSLPHALFWRRAFTSRGIRDLRSSRVARFSSAPHAISFELIEKPLRRIGMRRYFRPARKGGDNRQVVIEVTTASDELSEGKFHPPQINRSAATRLNRPPRSIAVTPRKMVSAADTINRPPSSIAVQAARTSRSATWPSTIWTATINRPPQSVASYAAATTSRSTTWPSTT